MTFRQDEYNLLVSDKRTVVSFSNNDAGDGTRIITMDAIIRPHSFLLNEKRTGIINPHRNMSFVPVGQIRACPRCGSDWVPITRREGKEKITTYTCESHCGVSICEDTYMRIVNLNFPTSDSIQRVAKVDIPSSEGDSMPRATETLTVQTEPTTNTEVKTLVLNFGSSAEAKPKPFVLNFGNPSTFGGDE